MKTIDLNCCLENDFEVITYTHGFMNGNIHYLPRRIEVIRKGMKYAAGEGIIKLVISNSQYLFAIIASITPLFSSGFI